MPAFVAATVPYDWPYDGGLAPTGTALVLCGVQRALAAAVPGAASVTARLVDLASTVRDAGGTVVWVRHGTRRAARGSASFLPVRGDDGWQPTVDAAPHDVCVDAAGWDGCFGSDLDHALRAAEVGAVLLGGLASELTVDSTVRTLNDRGHECLVLTDGCAPLDPALGARAHHSLTMSGGIFGALGTVSAVVAALAPATIPPHSASTARSTP
jgi:nicotinamidase-related amidase